MKIILAADMVMAVARIQKVDSVAANAEKSLGKMLQVLSAPSVYDAWNLIHGCLKRTSITERTLIIHIINKLARLKPRNENTRVLIRDASSQMSGTATFCYGSQIERSGGSGKAIAIDSQWVRENLSSLSNLLFGENMKVQVEISDCNSAELRGLFHIKMSVPGAHLHFMSALVDKIEIGKNVAMFERRGMIMMHVYLDACELLDKRKEKEMT